MGRVRRIANVRHAQKDPLSALAAMQIVGFLGHKLAVVDAQQFIVKRHFNLHKIPIFCPCNQQVQPVDDYYDTFGNKRINFVGTLPLAKEVDICCQCPWMIAASCIGLDDADSEQSRGKAVVGFNSAPYIPQRTMYTALLSPSYFFLPRLEASLV